MSLSPAGQEILTRAHTWLAEREADLVTDLQGLLRIPSLEAAAEPGAPFGPENRRALDYMIALSERAGMETTDMDGYCGFAEFGSGEKMVMTLGHVDVVPVGPGWKHEPFGAEIDGDYVYSRGASDDKGPTMAMFYAAWAIHAVAGDLGVRVRSVFGCNEESGFKCIEHYVAHEEAPTYGVAPDADWPCIHGEKGIATFLVRRPLPQGELTLLELEGGQRPNIVIDACRGRVRVAASHRAIMEAKVAEAWDANLSFAWHGDELEIHARGKAAHGSTPFAGDSALVRLLRFLMESAPVSQEDEYYRLFEIGHPGGNGLGIAGADQPSGPLTCNLGIVGVTDGQLEITVNVRYPVTFVGDEVRAKAEAKLAQLGHGYHLEQWDDSPPLYFPIDHPLVAAITEAYQAETGESRTPRTMGGGTYARAVPNCVAIGTGWEGDGPAHETDERFKIAHLHRAARIYVRILLGLIEKAR